MREGKTSIPRSFSHVAGHELPPPTLRPLPSPTLRHLQKQPSALLFEEGQCCPRTVRLSLPPTYKTRFSGRQNCFSIALPKSGPKDAHTSLPHTCPPAAWVPFLTFRSHFSNGMAGREQSSQGNYPVKQTTLYFLFFFLSFSLL